MLFRSVVARNILFAVLGALGLPLEKQATGGGSIDAYVDLLVSLRNEARAGKNFPLSDRIRDGLKDLGVTIKDRGAESTWEKA